MSSSRTARESLHRFAILLKVEIRLKIASELYNQAMSPKGFFERFGGGSVERVAQHFAVLEEHGWLRRTGQKKKDSGRRGPAETLYRTTEMPFMDDDTWALLPYSIRLAFSRGCFGRMARELRVGLEDAAFRGHPARNFACIQLDVDEVGWARILAAANDDFRAIFEEQGDAEKRVARSGGELRRAGILQLAFESPGWGESVPARLVEGTAGPPVSFAARAASVFADELSRRIVAELNRNELSVRQFHRKFADGASEGAVRYRFERLKDLAWIGVSGRVTKRGAPETLYRATRPLPPDFTWGDVPDALRATEPWKTFVRLSALVEEALLSGTFESRLDRHLTWSIVNLDAEGWRNAKRRSNELAAFVRAEQDRAQARIAKGAEPLTMVVGLAAIRQPQVGVSRAP